MADNQGDRVAAQAVETDTDLHEKEGSARRGWPALLLTIFMVAAGVYAYSPRSYPPSPPTRIHITDLQINSLAYDNGLYVAVGEQGHILVTDHPAGKWRLAGIDKPHSATLTRVEFIGKGIAVAVGQGAWILRSRDGGKTWTQVHFDKNKESSEPLLGVAGPFNGKLFAYGAFGMYLTSTDMGKTWQSGQFNLEKPAAGENKAAASDVTNPDSPDYDPFAAFSSGGGIAAQANKHLYAIIQAADGSLYLTGERGLLARSTDNGETWNKLKPGYDGSFFGLLALSDGRVIVYGLRGHVYYSDDQGKTWTRSDVNTDESLFGGTVLPNGNIVLVGANNEMLLSTDNAASFREVSQFGPYSLTSILALPDGKGLVSGKGGVVVKKSAGGDRS